MIELLRKLCSQKMMAVANSKGIPFQLLVRTGGVTEGSAIHLTREGIRSCPLQVPSYYSHTGVEIVNVADITQTSKLLAHLLEEF